VGELLEIRRIECGLNRDYGEEGKTRPLMMWAAETYAETTLV
jgi:hypothetical protein